LRRAVLITGSDGFSASHLVPLLREKEAARIFGIGLGLGRADGYFDGLFRGDILDAEFVRSIVRETRPDHVYHLAAVVPVAQVRREFPRALRVNVEGTYNLLESLCAEAPDARVLIVGSSDEYGARSPEEMPLRESDTFSPVNEYGVTKVAQELLSRLYCRERGMHILFTRTFNFTGPGQPADFVCSSFARQVAQCRLRGGGVIRTGDLDIVRDFLDIRDAARAYAIILEKGIPGCIYNVCSGHGISLESILNILKQIASVSITAVRDETRVRKADIPYLVGCNDRLRELGWESRFAMTQTLRDLVESWERQEP
jgi:GDP-4-dehydro-6-deoxy-D-mannose reductase